MIKFSSIFRKIFITKISENVNTEIEKNRTDDNTSTTTLTTTTSPSFVNFNVTVKTSPVTWSGTDALIFLHLGIGNETSEYLLKNQPGKDILEHDQVDKFTFQERIF